jgi:hypothetical protein
MHLIKRSFWLALALGLGPQLAAAGCGARTPLRVGDAGTDAPLPCVTEGDCPSDACTSYQCNEGVCQVANSITCNDQEPCTTDRCNPGTGVCEFQPVTLDQDQDGVRAPRPGSMPGGVDACGDDCDDTSAAAFPGAEETCDGVDNDCNGVVDDGYALAGGTVGGMDAVRISGQSNVQARRGGFANNGSYFAASYSGQANRWNALLAGFDRDASPVVPETQISKVSSDTFAGGLVWTGSMFGSVWDDRRDGDYEVYFNRLDADGNKLGPDLRLTNAFDFSINSQIAWNGLEFVVVWEDRRENQTRIFGQRISVDGAAIGANVELTDADWGSESPVLALSRTRIGVAFTNRDGSIGFRSFAVDLSDPRERVLLTSTPAFRPTLVHNTDRFVLAWEPYDTGPSAAIRGAVLADDGRLLVADKALTSLAGSARTPALHPLGDRVVLAWAGNPTDGFELFARTLSNDLEPLSPVVSLTSGASDSQFPSLAASGDGSLGVLFEDHRSGAWQVYFARLDCVFQPIE